MTPLQSLTAAPTDTTAFPEGYTLSPPRLIDYAEAEQEAARQYLQQTIKATATFPQPTRDIIHQRAVDNLRANPFAFGSPQFDSWATSISAVPFLAWLLLRIKHPQLTLAQSAQLLGAQDALQRARAVWALWGYISEKKVPPPQAIFSPPDPQSPSTGPSIGEASSAD